MVAFINLNKSKGNYVVDSDGNTLLDMAGTEFNPLGYNHQAMIKATWSQEFDAPIVNSNLTTNEIVGKDFFDFVDKTFMPLAPAHLQAVTFARGGQGVEKAVMTAMAQRILNDP